MKNATEFTLTLAMELAIADFCTLCQNKGMSVEQARTAITKHIDMIAERARQYMAGA
jgi:hypothetical protein